MNVGVFGLLALAACAGEVMDERSKHIAGDDVAPASGEGWVDELAVGVDPCGVEDLSSCERSTAGACGVGE